MCYISFLTKENFRKYFLSVSVQPLLYLLEKRPCRSRVSLMLCCCGVSVLPPAVAGGGEGGGGGGSADGALCRWHGRWGRGTGGQQHSSPRDGRGDNKFFFTSVTSFLKHSICCTKNIRFFLSITGHRGTLSSQYREENAKETKTVVIVSQQDGEHREGTGTSSNSLPLDLFYWTTKIWINIILYQSYATFLHMLWKKLKFSHFTWFCCSKFSNFCKEI